MRKSFPLRHIRTIAVKDFGSGEDQVWHVQLDLEGICYLHGSLVVVYVCWPFAKNPARFQEPGQVLEFALYLANSWLEKIAQ